MKKQHQALLVLLIAFMVMGGLLVACQKDEVQVMGTTNFDNLGLGTGEALDVSLGFDGNVQDFYIALDDSADDLLIGLGSVVGTTPGLSIDENLAVTTYGDLTFGGTTPVLTIGDDGAEDAAIVYDGNAQEFYIALYDTDDDLIIGLGSAIGTTPIMSFDENQIVSIGGNKLDLDADLDTSIVASTDDRIEIEVGGSNEYTFTASVFSVGGNKMTLDADEDTSITADTDDQIDLEIGGANEFTFTTSLFDVGAKAIDLDEDGDTSITADTDDQIDFELGGANEFTFTVALFDMGAKAIVLDEDGDSSITADTDDQLDLELSGANEYTFTVTSFDVGAKAIIFDEDGDSSITADTDDQFDLELGGANEYTFTTSLFDVGAKPIDLDEDGDTSITADTDDQIDFEISGADEYVFTAGIFDIATNTLNRIDLDADNDTSIRSSADDQIDFEVGGADILVISAAATAGAGNALINLTESFNIMDGSDSYYGLDINLTGANHTGSSNILTGIDLDLTTADPQVNEVALDVSDGDWDVAIEAGAVPIVSTAQTWMEDFFGDTIAVEVVLLNGSDGQALDPALVTGAQYGVATLVSGDVNSNCAADCSELALGLHWSADQSSLVFEIRMHIDTTVTNASVCAGFTDLVTLEDPAAIAGTSITITATDAIVFCYDTDATTDQWYAIGVAAGTPATGNAITGVAPTADVYQTLRIEVDAGGDDARFFIDGTLRATLTADAVSVAVLLTPVVVVTTRTTSSVTVDLDYIFVSSQRD